MIDFKIAGDLRVIKSRILFFILAYLLNASSLSAQTTYYIDPGNVSDTIQDGSREHPFVSYLYVPQASYSYYLLKRGTVFNTGNYLDIICDNVSFGSYGQGDRPKIIYSGQEYAFNANSRKNICFRSLDIEAINALANIHFTGEGSDNILIEDCFIHGAQWGIRATGNTSLLKIINCEIFNIYYDGIFANADKIEIANCHIYDVNQAWFIDPDESFSNGDCIQLTNPCKEFNIHHNILDKTGTGNKYCFNVSGMEKAVGVFEYNTCLAEDSLNSSCLFMGSIGMTDVRYNVFKSGKTGIYANLHSAKIHYNKITNCDQAIKLKYSGATLSEVYNNVLYDNRVNISSDNAPAKVNNNIIYLTQPEDIALQYLNVQKIKSDHNLIYPEQNNFIKLGEINFNTISDFQEVSGLDNNSKTADPQFADAAVGDFHVQSTSPSINAGTELGLKQDFEGSLLQDGKPDIGCFESKNKVLQNQDAMPETQNIKIPKGWSMISTYIDPIPGNLKNVLGPVLSDIIIVKDERGNIFWPGFDVNQIGNIVPAEGYLICTHKDCTVEVSGIAVKPENMNIYLPDNYSYVGYPRKKSAPIDSVLSSISKQIQLVKDGDGLLFWNDYDINEIGNMEAGRGYQIKMNGSAEFHFPANE
ncbi:MAG: right-handed parallel beta-helix repeat-containing protein [Bacteroidales bacterium]|nr:right-handed parallel beta-helix repeat-containing protein [Bacteroidales bacterium]MCF8456802.1 right-handed parallel beta-helix repeat-containing protein [Bacteroidales bacterium]